jgi:predicted nucleic acid-binding protein
LNVLEHGNLHRVSWTIFFPHWTRVAEEYGQLQAEQKVKGRPIPSADAQIAATARVFGLVLLSVDRHMHQVENLLVESWL